MKQGLIQTLGVFTDTPVSYTHLITFAGQAIDLLRYDHRERMDRELMSFTYMHSTTCLLYTSRCV